MLPLGKFSFVFMTLLCGQTLAQTSGMVRIGVMNDMAGQLPLTLADVCLCRWR